MRHDILSKWNLIDKAQDLQPCCPSPRLFGVPPRHSIFSLSFLSLLAVENISKCQSFRLPDFSFSLIFYSRRNFNNLSFMSGYAPLKEESERDSQSGEDSEALLSQQETLHRRKSQNGFFWLLVVLIPITSVCLLGLGAWIGSQWFANPNDICPAHVQHYCEFSNTRSHLWI
jgi:hypothetical protein